MSAKVEYFNSVSLSLPRKEIYTRLGYREGKTNISQSQQELVENYIDQAAEILELKAAYCRIAVSENANSRVVLSNGNIFESKNLANLLQDCSEVLLMAATGGNRVVDLITELSRGEDVTKAVVFDAVASETVDAVLDWLMELLNRQLRRENKHLLTRRYSAGYGDLILANQKTIYDTLELKTIEVTINEKFILKPEKSVTAITGITAYN